MTGIEMLRDLAAGRLGAVPERGLGSRTLRFVVEYDSEVEVAAKAQEISDAIGIEGIQFFALFDEVFADPEFGEFYVLQFPGLERTVDNRTLFSIAHEVQALLGAVSVEPDLGSEIYQEPLPSDALPEGILKDFFRDACFVTDPAPADRQWALDRAGVLRAFVASDARGTDIRIAQPDTGVTQHVELSDVVTADGFNVLTGAFDATDPLTESGNPGHGTGTSSVMTSGPLGEVSGAAPRATLVPIRCIDSVLLTFNGGSVARAIDYARQRGCHVVTMSLGGPPSRAMKKAIKQATQSDIIVLAAAGNCVGLVVYPARYDEVIAVAGSNVLDQTWIGSSHGDTVDITAPAENVWKAIAGPGGTRVGGGQGTSFAVALTAGVAALWLSHHGRDAVTAAAAARGMSVQALFREVLTESARAPAGWDTVGFGAGMVDAEAVLLRTLDGPSLPDPEGPSGGTTADTMHLLSDALGPESASNLAEVASQPQFQLELSSLVLEDARVGVVPGDDVDAETGLVPEAVSPQLRDALGIRAGELGNRPASFAVRPSLRTDRVRATDPVVLVAGRPNGLEAASDIRPEAAREILRAEGNAPLDALAAKVLRVRDHADGPRRAALASLHDDLLRDTAVVLDHLREGIEIPDDPGQLTALEALVQLQGRPALRLSDDGVDLDDPELGDWEGAVVLVQSMFRERQRSVGRVDSSPGRHAGTAFVVDDGLVMTNRHVLEAIAFPTPSRTNPTGWILTGSPVVNFSPSGVDPRRSFKVLGVAFSGPDPIEGRVDLAHLDLALLRVEETNAVGQPLPAPLTLTSTPIATGAARMFVVGYPALPLVLPRDEAGKLRMDVVRRLQEIYDMQYGVRYLSPGLVMTDAAEVPDSPHNWVFTHDATSLGGNSGSCVLSFDHGLQVAGLHFAGNWLRANLAHAIDQTRSAFAGVLP